MSVESIQSALDKLRDTAPVIVVENDFKMLFTSDAHKGIKDEADDFYRAGHESLLTATRKEYRGRRYFLGAGGDEEDIWENPDIAQIRKAYGNPTVDLLRIAGNHDATLSLPEAYRFQFSDGRYILWTHGHKGDWGCDAGSWLGRAFVRYVWAGIGQRILHLSDPTTARQEANPKKHLAVRQATNEWASRQDEKMIALIWGHSHFQEQAGRSFNDGSWIGPRGEAVELNGQDVTLKTFT